MNGRSLVSTAVVALAATLGARQAPAPQAPALTFRSVANFVEVDAIVTDRAGAPVRDLTCGDFNVREDGRPQNLSVCAFVDIPVTRVSGPAAGPALRPAGVRPDVVSNAKPFDGRVFVIVLDAFHVAPLRGLAVKRQADKFIDEYLGDNDVAAVVEIGHGSYGQEFTGDRAALKAAVDRFTGDALPSETVNLNRDALNKNSVSQAGYPADQGPPQDLDAGPREFMARESLTVIRQVAETLGAVTGRRKALLLFSEGIGIDRMKIDDTSAREAGSTAAFLPSATDTTSIRRAETDMFSAAAKSNVSIYSIDPRGLTTGQEDAAELGVSPGADNPTRDYSNPRVHDDAADESRRQQDALRSYAEQTGGLAMIDRNDMDEVFRRIVEDNSAYYVLGYASPDARHDGEYHRISVKVNRPGVSVRTQQGYTAPDAHVSKTPPDAVADLIASPVAVGGLGMSVNASAFGGTGPMSTVHLTVQLDGKGVPLKASGDRFTNDIDIQYAALDHIGRQQAGARQVAHLKLLPATREAFAGIGVRYVAEFELGPGHYQVRVAAREHETNRAGSVFCDLDVPDIVHAPLAMSDLLASSSAAARTPTPLGSSKIDALFSAPTTTDRTFTPADTLVVAATFYDNDARAAHRVAFRATVQSAGGAVVFTRDDSRPATDLARENGGFAWVVQVPLTSLVPGRYVLSVEGRSTAAGTPPVGRQLTFEVR